MYLKKFENCTGKYLCWGLFLIKLQTWRPSPFFKKDSNTVVFLWNFGSFKNIYFEEHLRTTAPECLRKKCPLLVLGKPMLSDRRNNWATNTLHCKYVSHEVS